MEIHIGGSNADFGASGSEGPSKAKVVQKETHPMTLPASQGKSVCPASSQVQANMKILAQTFASKGSSNLLALAKTFLGASAGARLAAGIAAAVAALTREKPASLSSLLSPGEAPPLGNIARAVATSTAASTPSQAAANFKNSLTQPFF